MRQSGVIAAAALYALDHNWDRLAEDHDNAHHLAEGLANIKGLEIDVPRMQTNLVFFEVKKPGWTRRRLVEACKERGVGIGANTGHPHPRRHPSRRQPRRHRHRPEGDQRRDGGVAALMIMLIGTCERRAALPPSDLDAEPAGDAERVAKTLANSTIALGLVRVTRKPNRIARIADRP